MILGIKGVLKNEKYRIKKKWKDESKEEREKGRNEGGNEGGNEGRKEVTIEENKETQSKVLSLGDLLFDFLQVTIAVMCEEANRRADRVYRPIR